MKVVIVGSGGREFAIASRIARSHHVTEIWVTAGNPMLGLIRCGSGKHYATILPFSAMDVVNIAEFAGSNKVDLVIVGPEAPLGKNLGDLLQKQGTPCIAPKRNGAMLELSKAHAQEFMEQFGVMHAYGRSFTTLRAALPFIRELHGKCAIKADGEALGKGVEISTDTADAIRITKEILAGKYGSAGERIVIQEYLEGTEASLQILVDAKDPFRYVEFPCALDHKRLGRLNTGGMGAVSPGIPFTEEQKNLIRAQIISPILTGCVAESIDTSGVFFPGIMLTKEGPKVLEINRRCPDPETQATLLRLESDLFELLYGAAIGELDKVRPLRWNNKVGMSVVLAAGGYPEKPEKGKLINGIDEVEKLGDVEISYSGVSLQAGALYTNGGRVLTINVLADTVKEAQEKANHAAELITFEGKQYRSDIGESLIQR